jgi:hypothetical protein
MRVNSLIWIGLSQLGSNADQVVPERVAHACEQLVESSGNVSACNPRVDLNQRLLVSRPSFLNARSLVRKLIMKKSVFCLMLAGAPWPSATPAQVSIDMARVTCADYLALPAADSAVFSAWMSGWFNQKTVYVFVDLNAYARNVANVRSWCALNPTQTVMAGLQHATAR